MRGVAVILTGHGKDFVLRQSAGKKIALRVVRSELAGTWVFLAPNPSKLLVMRPILVLRTMLIRQAKSSLG